MALKSWKQIVTDIANAFRSLTGTTANIKVGELAGKVSDIPKVAAQTITPGTADQTIASGQYLNGTQTIKGDANLVAGNIKNGVSIFGKSGTVNPVVFNNEFVGTLYQKSNPSTPYNVYDIQEKIIDSPGSSPIDIWEISANTTYSRTACTDTSGCFYVPLNEWKSLGKFDTKGNQVWSLEDQTDQVASVAIDVSGYIYIGGYNNVVKKLNQSGTQISSYDMGISIVDLKVISGYIYFCGGNDFVLRKCNSNGIRIWDYTDFSGSVGHIDVDSNGNSCTGDASGCVQKINTSGTKVWEMKYEINYYGVESICADSGGNVYAGVGSVVYKLNSNGAQVWSFQAYGPVFNLKIVDGYIYAGVSYNYIHKLDSNGNEIWKYKGPPRSFSAMTFDTSNNIYIVTKQPGEISKVAQNKVRQNIAYFNKN